MDTHSEKEFTLRYVGRRFDGARLPLDVVSDLPAFRNLIVAFAKDIWKVENKGRVRLPKGFEQAMAFDLVDLTDGSAKPKIAWHSARLQDLLPGFSDYYDTVVEKAYEKVLDLMDRASHGDYPAERLSSQVVKAFDRFGSALREGEHIEFEGSRGRDGNVVAITPQRRRDFLKRVQNTYSSRVEGLGVLTGLNVESGSIDIQTDHDGNIRLPMAGDEVHDTFDGNTRQRVRYDVTLLFGREDEVKGVLEVHDVALVDDEVDRAIEKVSTRLSNLSAIESGWMDGQGEAINRSAIENVQRLVGRRSALSVAFRIFPMLSGGLQIEFEAGGWDLTVEFEHDGSAELYAVQLNGNGEVEPKQYASLDDDLLHDLDRIVGEYPRTGVFG